MSEDNPTRDPNKHDRPCDECGDPMIGIMIISDYNGYRAPRSVCVGCEEVEEEILNAEAG